MKKKQSALILNPGAAAQIFGPAERDAIRACTDLREGVMSADEVSRDPSLMADVEILFTGWGAPCLNASLLAAAKRLEAVFYGAGSIRGVVTPEFWDRKIPITSSWQANAVPVAEFTEALIVLALKRFWTCAAQVRTAQTFAGRPEIRGAYGARVGILSLGMIGRLVAARLQSHDLDVLAYDPFLTQADADSHGLGVEMVSLETIFSTCDVVSLHAPNLPETRGMVSAPLLGSMRPGATLINTARGAVVDEAALIETLVARPDLFALLDVTDPEPPVKGSPLYTLPNVVLTPHIAGSMGDECRRMGRLAVDECQRFLDGRPLQFEVTRRMAEVMA